MKKNNFSLITLWILTLLPLLITLAVYTRLPEVIPTHWNAAGQIDGWGTRPMAFLMPAVGVGCQLLLTILPRLDPKRDSYAQFGGAYFAVRIGLALFMLLMSGITLIAAIAPQLIAADRLIMAALGGLFCLIGNFMPKFRHNWFVGIKTPWTLADERVWIATHRMAGPLWFGGGLLIMALCAFLNSLTLSRFSIAILLVITLIPCVYSYVEMRRLQKQDAGQQAKNP